MATRLALAHSSSRLILASIVTVAICSAFPKTSFAGKFIDFTTPKAPANGVYDPTDLQITVTNGTTISKATAVLPNVAWPAPGKTGNGVIAGNVVTFNSVPGFLRAGDVVTGTISIAKGVPNLAITDAEWSYRIPLANQPVNFAKNGVKVSKLDVGGGGTASRARRSSPTTPERRSTSTTFCSATTFPQPTSSTPAMDWRTYRRTTST